MPQAHLESMVLSRVRGIILQERHLEALVRLVNDELRSSLEQVKERLGTMDSQIGDVDGRLERLYDALETGKVDLDDLAPRMRQLRERRDLLLRARNEAQETVSAGKVELVNREAVLGYLRDPDGVLEQGSVGEKRAFLRSFIQAIEKHNSQVTIRYTMPLPPEQVPVGPPGVLDIDSYGGACGVRTRDLRLERAVS